MSDRPRYKTLAGFKRGALAAMSDWDRGVSDPEVSGNRLESYLGEALRIIFTEELG